MDGTEDSFEVTSSTGSDEWFWKHDTLTVRGEFCKDVARKDTSSSWKSGTNGRRRGSANIKGEVCSLEKGNCGSLGFGS
ncbi:hypothetical protein TNCV_2876281 [Trichonephila clavipes]|nr:hypothetical protein TNCV_2876281 [Trichonephila clavipes]